MTRQKQPIRRLVQGLRSTVQSLYEPFISLYFGESWKFIPLRVAKERLKLNWVSFHFETFSPYKHAYEERQNKGIFRLGAFIVF